MRTWLYMSGVLFSIQALVLQHASHVWAMTLLQLNPAAIYITMAMPLGVVLSAIGLARVSPNAGIGTSTLWAAIGYDDGHLRGKLLAGPNAVHHAARLGVTS